MAYKALITQPGHWKQDCPELTPEEREEAAESRRLSYKKADTGENGDASSKRLSRGMSVKAESSALLGNHDIQEWPDTPWGRGMAMSMNVKATVLRVEGIPNVNDECYHCRMKGKWCFIIFILYNRYNFNISYIFILRLTLFSKYTQYFLGSAKLKFLLFVFVLIIYIFPITKDIGSLPMARKRVRNGWMRINQTTPMSMHT